MIAAASPQTKTKISDMACKGELSAQNCQYVDVTLFYWKHFNRKKESLLLPSSA